MKNSRKCKKKEKILPFFLNCHWLYCRCWWWCLYSVYFYLVVLLVSITISTVCLIHTWNTNSDDWKSSYILYFQLNSNKYYTRAMEWSKAKQKCEQRWTEFKLYHSEQCIENCGNCNKTYWMHSMAFSHEWFHLLIVYY